MKRLVRSNPIASYGSDRFGADSGPARSDRAVGALSPFCGDAGRSASFDPELFLPNKPGTSGKHEKARVGSGDSPRGHKAQC
jgi:hypothetical protein